MILGAKKKYTLPCYSPCSLRWNKNEHKWLPSDPLRTADYQTPVNILGKYDNPVEKSMRSVCPGTKISQQMSESPLSSLNKQLNWGRFTNYLQNWVSRGYCFCWRHRLNLSPTERFCAPPLVELVGQINQRSACSLFALIRLRVDDAQERRSGALKRANNRNNTVIKGEQMWAGKYDCKVSIWKATTKNSSPKCWQRAKTWRKLFFFKKK